MVILVSPLKIDKYTGQVFQLVTGSKGLSWQLIQAEKHPRDKATPNEQDTTYTTLVQI